MVFPKVRGGLMVIYSFFLREKNFQFILKIESLNGDQNPMTGNGDKKINCTNFSFSRVSRTFDHDDKSTSTSWHFAELIQW